jgi:GTP-binding protein Era
MLIEHQNPYNKSIMISVLGKPNAGKSTLINHFLGFDLAIVSNKPQTTRNQYHCALTIDHTEIVFVDTPGVHDSSKEINIRMNGQALYGSEGVDLNFLLVDASIGNIKEQIMEFYKGFDFELAKTWLILTKLDRVESPEKINLDTVLAEAKEIIPNIEKIFCISSKEGTNIHDLTGAICDEATEGPHMYPDGSVSNKNERFFASEYIREQAFRTLKDELPYELAVVVEDFEDYKELGDKKLDARISASILVNRPSQRAIVVGSKGSVIKQIGTGARKKIEALVGGPVHLNLHVKVSPKWFKNNFVLDEIGLPRTHKSHRVWRQK